MNLLLTFLSTTKARVSTMPQYKKSFLNKWVDVGYLMNGVGERYALPQNTESNRIAGYVEHSASLSRRFEVRKCTVALQLECQNFTDVQYEVIQYYPMPARSYRITVKVNF